MMTGRGQSTIIGFVMVFGIVVMLLLVLQTSAVPAWNQNVEYAHNERVKNEMELLRDDVFRTAATGSSSSQPISLGTEYPVRPFLINPSDPSGSIRTTDAGTVTITNATATGETGDYWDGSTRAFVDRALVYEPDYNEYDNAPTTVLQNSVLFNQYGERTLPATGQRLVSGRQINVVTLTGNLSRSGQRTYSVDVRGRSAPEQVTTVRSEGPLVLTAPTRLSERTWEELLADERVAAGGYVTDVSVTSGDPGTLRLTLAAGESYDLRMAQVAVGSQRNELGPHYVTTESASELRLATGTADRLVFEVRDRYNNPVSGVDVNATLSGPGTLTTVDAVTDADGHAVFRYEATDSGDATVTATYGTDGLARREASVAITSQPSGGDGGGGTTGCVATPWSPTNTSVTVAGADVNCVWPGLSGVSRLALSDPRFTPLRGNHDDLDPSNEYFRLTFVADVGSHQYLFEVTDDTDGVKRQLGSGSWSNRNVVIYRKSGDQAYTKVGDGSLSEGVLEAWYQGTDDVDLLAANSYDKPPKGLAQVRNDLRKSADTEVYIVEIDGRVTITAT